MSTSKLQFCPNCDYYLYLNGHGLTLTRICRNCGFEKKNDDGLVMETDLREKSSEGYKVIVNEFTQSDPTLPHIHNIKCPNADCKSNREFAGTVVGTVEAAGAGAAGAGAAGAAAGADATRIIKANESKLPVINSDIIYLKYDPENMKYVYICNDCNTSWKSK